MNMAAEYQNPDKASLSREVILDKKIRDIVMLSFSLYKYHKDRKHE